VGDIHRRFVQSNGIRMHVAEAGQGPLVVLCHGFPELWYSWRHQLPALAAAGFHAVAPDQRGYGQTDCPEAIGAYDLFQLAGDIVGLVQAMGQEQAVIVGHDWGAPVAWYSALLRPDMFRAIALMSVFYFPRLDMRPTDAMRMVAGDRQFYQLYFQEPGKAEAELDRDPRKSLRTILYALSGDPPPEKRMRFLFDKDEGFLATGLAPDTLPSWLTEADVDAFAAAFQKTGFRGGLNWYRNLDRIWESTPFLAGARLSQPAVFIAGEVDAVISMYRPFYDSLEATVPNLRKKVLLEGAGHWIQQERPAEVNRLLLDFLASLA
jgi:pimeloyl-ACP methyl ester carboxylesterase